MPASDIVIKGAREHNLKSVDLVLPRNKLICLTGVSGSGKSSLAFDTLYAEGQRRYVESLSSYARQFLGQMPKPDVDFIGGLSPSISISQKSAGTNPRSTVGTITEVYDYLRVLYARVGDGHCPKCGRPITSQTREQIIQRLLDLEPGTRFHLLAPLIRGQKGEYRDLFADLLKQGFVRARVDGTVVRLSDDLNLDRQMRHNIEVVVDRLSISREARARIAEAVELALGIGKGNLIVAFETDVQVASPSQKAKKRAAKSKRSSARSDLVLSAQYACTQCGDSFDPPSPQLFSFNSPQGMCLQCDGLGQAFTFDPDLLIPNPKLSFKRGCFELLGKWSEMGRWRRHIYQGVAETVERTRALDSGTMLETPWKDLDPQLRKVWLWGTGDQHITFTWRAGANPMKYGGQFDGIVPRLQAKHRETKSRPKLLQLEKYMRTVTCPECHGQRLNAQARAVRVSTGHAKFRNQPDLSLPDFCRLSVADAADFFADLRLDASRQLIAAEAIKEIRGRLGFLMNVGLDYLSLDRTAPTLSGGESQRIRLAGQIGCGLVGVVYILDEPSIGLHARDNDRLLATLAQLRDMGNTVVVVEHDEDTMRSADHIIDFGPGPGVRGGEVVAEGKADQLVRRASRSVTGKYLAGKLAIEIPPERRAISEQALAVFDARHNNLKGIDVEIPLGAFVCVTGVSGSGKSSLVNDILVESLRRDLNHGNGAPGLHDRIEGLEHLDKLIAIDQTPIGRTPRSNPVTYIKVFDEIRKLYAQLPDSKRRGYKPGRFSFNVDGGRCQACDGNGSNRLEMDFLADVWVTCPVCAGRRFNRETLNVRFKGQSIADVLSMDIQQAMELFANIPGIHGKLKTLHDVGLDYLKLGQPSPTLSGGEAQRIKLARELVKKSTGQTLYLLDEPTTGLHFADIQMLLKVLHDFVDAGNTVLIVEHNLDVIKTADWIIDLGPEGGDAGGRIVCAGTPEQVAKHRSSHTGKALRHILQPVNGRNGSPKSNGKPKRKRQTRAAKLATQIEVRGARQHNLKDVDVKISRDKMTVLCGPSGSGKSSLAMDTIYAEGQRRYVESLSAYARQFVAQMQKPQLEKIEGLSPAIAIEQQNLGNTPRSTVGTVTEIYDYLRILFARAGTSHCPTCDVEIGTQSADEIVDKVMAEPAGSKLYLMAPVQIEVGQHYDNLWNEVRTAGFARIRVDGQTHSIDTPPDIDRRRRHEVEVVVDRIVVRPKSRSRIADSVEAALDLGQGVLVVAYPRDDLPEPRWETTTHSQHLACGQCGRSFEPLSPHHFSFNSHLGWCTMCEGLGTQIGANPDALIRSGQMTLAQGALLLWPNLEMKLSQAMLHALSERTGLPLDVPLDELSSRHRRVILHGLGEDVWIDVHAPGRKTKNCPLFRFQYRGLYPALDEAAKLSPSLRNRLQYLVSEVECTSCAGARLRQDAGAVRFRDQTIGDLCRLPLGKLHTVVNGWRLDSREKKIANELVREIRQRVQFLVDVGLEYLTLGRPATTLSGGEAQRIRLASQLGSGLCGVLYVLDEPTIGLHPRDNNRLLKALQKLRDLGNTLLIVEHDREVIANSDALLDFGPAAGKNGGQVVAKGSPRQVKSRRTSVTGPYLSGKKAISIPNNRRTEIDKKTNRPVFSRHHQFASESSNGQTSFIPELKVFGARQHNLRDIDVAIPLGVFTCVTGVSGSGKSSLVNDILYASLSQKLHRASTTPGAHDRIEGIEHINKVIRVDQQPLGYSPSSNPATYTGAFDLIRELFSQLPEAKLRGYTARRFSFNVPGGRCDACEGNGQACIEMHFLPDVWVTCETCGGHRYNEETLDVKFHGSSIAQVLEMTCREALVLFENLPKIRRILQTLCDVGLDYLTLGQSAPTLSGGEAQRVKLAAELARPDTGRTLYLLDEPTTGLHFDDLGKLLVVLQRLVDLGNSVVVIEHNLDVIKSADWIIDIGPDAGAGGGLAVAQGTPESVAKYAAETLRSHEKRATKHGGSNGKRRTSKKASASAPTELPPRSFTGELLCDVLETGAYDHREVFHPAEAQQSQEGDIELSDVGLDTKMPWELNGREWHCTDRVDRRGQPVQWDGEILEQVVDRIQNQGDFSDTDWNSRSIVEIRGQKKSDGWFFHAITAETWLLKLKFRVVKNTFKKGELESRIPLKTLNQMDDIPVYGNDPRVKVKTLRGPWQEIEIRAHSLKEIDTGEFWQFVDQAVKGFLSFGESASSPEDWMPWKKLGKKWHLMRKGFPTGKKVLWKNVVLERLIDALEQAAPDAKFHWTNQVLVNATLDGGKAPWAVILTKKPDYVEVVLSSPKGSIAFGRAAQLGRDSQAEPNPDCDVVRIRFRTVAEVTQDEFLAYLKEHVAACRQ